MYGVDIVELFFTKPHAFVNVVTKHYQSRIAVNLIIKNVFIKPPVALAVGKYSEDELLEMFSDNSDGFFEELIKCIDFKESESILSIVKRRKRSSIAVHI